MFTELFGRNRGVPEVDPTSWEPAFVGEEPIWRRNVHLATLVLRNDPTKKVYASLVTEPSRVSLDIPLTDQIPQRELAQLAYLNGTFLGEIDPLKFSRFATNTFNTDHLLAFLNRTSANAEPDEVPSWFYRTFKVEHGQSYRDVYISSHGGRRENGYNFNATIERSNRIAGVQGMTPEATVDFLQVVQRSLPHINAQPLSVDSYLQNVQTTLKFLPKDWEI